MNILYLTSEYPGISHTFIIREIQQLRLAGASVATASIRRPGNLSKMPAAEQAEAKETFYIKPELGRLFLGAFAALLFSAPHILAAMLARAVAWCALDGPRSPLKAVGYWLEAVVLLKEMLARDYHHVHVHFANPAATVAMLAALHPQVDFSFSAHGPDIFYDTTPNQLARKVERACFVRCISHYCRSQLMRLVSTDHWPKLHIVRCGVDLEAFSPAPEPAADNTGIRLLCVGRICVAKAQPILVQACEKIQQAGLRFHLTFVGGGESLEALKEMAEHARLSEHITFTGPVGQDVARQAYNLADIFVLPSFAEGVPVVLMEAMAKQVPCISTTVHGIPELIDSGQNGLLVFPGDVDGLTHAILRLGNDENLRKNMGLAGRKKIAALYDLQTNILQLVRLFQDNAGDD